MPIDIKIKLKGYWYSPTVFRNIIEHSINYTDYQVMIQFKKIDKKTGLEREYIITIPKTELGFITLRIIEDKK